MTEPPYLITVRVVPEGAAWTVVTYVDGAEADRCKCGSKNEALRAAKDLEQMLVQTGGKLAPKGSS